MYERLTYDVEFAKRTGPVVDKPGIDTSSVILVLTWKNSKFLKFHHEAALDKRQVFPTV